MAMVDCRDDGALRSLPCFDFLPLQELRSWEGDCRKISEAFSAQNIAAICMYCKIRNLHGGSDDALCFEVPLMIKYCHESLKPFVNQCHSVAPIGRVQMPCLSKEEAVSEVKADHGNDYCDDATSDDHPDICFNENIALQDKFQFLYPHRTM